MRWIEAALPTKSEDIELLCMRLNELGVEGMSIEDENDFKDFLENNHQYWDYVDDELNCRFEGKSQIKFYLSDDEQGRQMLKDIKTALSAQINISYVEDSDWENNWREFYKPLRIGDRLMVVPEWESPDCEGRVALRLDPGLIFGTGSHATTRMCLCELQKLDLQEKSVLDLGCGSGILGIGALVLGCKNVVGCDIDPKAPDVAASNAALNGIGGDKFSIFAGDVLDDGELRKTLGTGYDVVLTNIVADVIIRLAECAREFMGENAVFICSGIIDGREDEVRSALEKNGMTVIDRIHDEEWNCFVCK